MRRPPDARLHAQGGIAPAQEADRPHTLAGVSHQRRRDGAGHVPRGLRHAARLLPQGRRRGRGGRARRARLSEIPAVALEAAAHEQRAGARQPRDKSPQPRRAGVPVGGVVGALVGAVMCEQDEIWSESRYFAQERIQELYDEKRATAPASSETPAAELAAEARKMIVASLELAERVEAA